MWETLLCNMPETLLYCILPVVVVYAAFVVLWVGGRNRFGRKRFWSVLLTSFPVFVFLLFLAGFAARAAASRPYHVYRSSFDLEPTPDVEITNSVWHDWSNPRTRYLKFNADQSTIDRIIAARQFEKERSGASFAKGDDPAWWNPPRGPGIGVYVYKTQFRTLDRRGEAEGSCDEILIYDPSTRETYYRYIGTD
jgi:hypothetical protein